MKKKITIALATILLSVTLFTTGVYAGTIYTEWKGTEDYYQTLENLNLIADAGEQMKVDRDNLSRENEQLNNTVSDKDNQINSLEQDITALEERINDGMTTRGQLEQAEKDMADVESKSANVLNNMKE